MKMRSSYQSAWTALRPVAQPGLMDALASSGETVRLWLSRRRERKALLQLDDHMLHDIGLDRLQVQRMASRPFWRA